MTQHSLKTVLQITQNSLKTVSHMSQVSLTAVVKTPQNCVKTDFNTVDGKKPFASFTEREKVSSFETGKWQAPKIVRDREHDRQSGGKRLFSTTSYSIEDGSLFSLIFVMVRD